MPRHRALRVASDGWELHVLQGAREWFETAPPDLVLVEVTFARLFAAFEDDAGAAAREAAETFAWLASLGYEDVAHAGEACDARRRDARRRDARRRDARKNAANAETKTSETFGGWCAFDPADVPFVARAACPERRNPFCCACPEARDDAVVASVVSLASVVTRRGVLRLNAKRARVTYY